MLQLEVGENREIFGAQASLKFFMVKFLKRKWLAHYDDWYDQVLYALRSDDQAPRGHGKSEFWALGVPLWDVIRGPIDWADSEDLLISYSEDQVRRLLRNIRLEVETNPLLGMLRPSTKQIWGTDLLEFPNGYMVSGLGFGTAARGKHPRRIIGDDVLKDIGGMSAEDQERAWFSVITGMAMPKTQIHIVGTPVEFGDLLEKLESNTEYAHWKKPAFNKDGSPLCPELFTKETLSFRRREMGSLNFSREFLLQRVDPATQPFKRQYETLYTELPSRFARTVTVCDPAYSENDGDYTAIVTVGFTGGNHAYVREAKGIRREDPGKVVNELVRTMQTQMPDAVGLEKRKGDALFYSFQEARTRLNLWDTRYVELTTHGKGKWDVSRIGGMVARWESRSIHLHPEMKLLREQLYAYRPDDKSKTHDDLVDALAWCFHPDMAVPNSGRQNVPLDEESASLEGKSRFHVGQSMWRQKSVFDWSQMKNGVSRGNYQWAQTDVPIYADTRIGE